MEPATAVAAYGAETVAEGAVAATVVIAQPTLPIKAAFQRIPTTIPLPRSSHSLSVIKGRAYVFGGEVRPREPVDNAVHIYILPASGVAEADYKSVAARPRKNGGEVPAARVGHTAAVVADRIYIFGGRGGKEMKPLEENGRVWVFDTVGGTWDHLDPDRGKPYPEPRSYHASAATEHPLPSKDDETLNPVGDGDRESHGTLFIHAGCPASGRRADVWAFDIASRLWSQYADAPGPARGGTCLTFAHSRLYRFGGFDGERELGGRLDSLAIETSTFNDRAGKGELGVCPKTGKWESSEFSKGTEAPGDRSVAGFHAVTTGAGRNYLLLFLGERDASSQGHDGAGRFWNDVWAYQLEPDSLSGAELKDAARELFGASTYQDSWAKVEVAEATTSDGQADHPGERGWFASASNRDLDAGGIVLWGGLNGKNERESDGWILTVNT